MTEQILDLKEQAAAIDVVFKLESECRKRGLEIQRQAAEILELKDRIVFLSRKIDTREAHISQLIAEKAELERYQS